METLKEHCGVIGAYSRSGDNVTPIIRDGLVALQNRGQESFGIGVHDSKSNRAYPTFKKAGLVLLNYEGDKRCKKRIDGMKGDSAIGHVRYSTTGSLDIGSFHPIDIDSTHMRIAHNGTISNIAEMRALLRDIEVKDGATDTELAGHLLSRFFMEKKDWVSAFARFDTVKNGSYCFVIQMPDGEIIAARDPRGYKPLCYGYHAETDSYVVASESFALSKVGAKMMGDIQPGQLAILNKNGIEFRRFSEEKERALDTFELTYFAHPASKIDGVSVAIARENIGRELFRKFKLHGDIIIPVPESAYDAADGYSQESGIRVALNSIGKDRYGRGSVMRSFIQPGNRSEITSGMFVVEEKVNGKRVIIIDDSVVRLTSATKYVKLLRDAGAEIAGLLLTFPPIRYPCYMGIDYPVPEELIAHRVAPNESLENVGAKVAEKLGIEFVGYMDPVGISRAVGIPVNSLCFSCVTGDYSKLNFVPQIKSRAEIKGVEQITARS